MISETKDAVVKVDRGCSVTSHKRSGECYLAGIGIAPGVIDIENTLQFPKSASCIWRITTAQQPSPLIWAVMDGPAAIASLALQVGKKQRTAAGAATS